MIFSVTAEVPGLLPHPAAPHMMVVMMVMMTMEHRAIRASHSHTPAAKTAKGIVEAPRAAIPVKRAGKQAADEGQYNNK